ncbi:hypothetical protein SCRM01_177 [Synechococcus phage S-CRM01]|uniref:hypothetical protein n=1 Tax=Synechococcus phage S-CRM01 TaxID=1026955 RepID=UPI000209E402|nr:hypothetical protein SCRM01_177 [Synechococcus phage S-CRM01]AEC53123.1 hypothetical protein SCRM01_177 [Synechococcus phage S-CRM01]
MSVPSAGPNYVTWREFFIRSPFVTQEEIDQVQELGWAHVANLYRQHSAGIQAQLQDNVY